MAASECSPRLRRTVRGNYYSSKISAWKKEIFDGFVVV